MYLSTRFYSRVVVLDYLLVRTICLYMYGNLERRLLNVFFRKTYTLSLLFVVVVVYPSFNSHFFQIMLVFFFSRIFNHQVSHVFDYKKKHTHTRKIVRVLSRSNGCRYAKRKMKLSYVCD